eukprot:2113114-Rhodomonas_salina.2
MAPVACHCHGHDALAHSPPGPKGGLRGRREARLRLTLLGEASVNRDSEWLQSTPSGFSQP